VTEVARAGVRATQRFSRGADLPIP